MASRHELLTSGCAQATAGTRPRGTQPGQNRSSQVSHHCSLSSAQPPRLCGTGPHTCRASRWEPDSGRSLRPRTKEKRGGGAGCRSAPRGAARTTASARPGSENRTHPTPAPAPRPGPTHPGPLSRTARRGRREQAARFRPAPGNGSQRRSRKLGGPRASVGAFWHLRREAGDGRGPLRAGRCSGPDLP